MVRNRFARSFLDGATEPLAKFLGARLPVPQQDKAANQKQTIAFTNRAVSSAARFCGRLFFASLSHATSSITAKFKHCSNRERCERSTNRRREVSSCA